MFRTEQKNRTAFVSGLVAWASEEDTAADAKGRHAATTLGRDGWAQLEVFSYSSEHRHNYIQFCDRNPSDCVSIMEAGSTLVVHTL